MPRNPELIFDPLASHDLAKFVEDNVVSHTIARTGLSEWFPVGFFLRSDRGEWVGGCIGFIWGGWMQVRWLWVTESLRGHGQGTRLMDAAEAYAVERGAQGATLETHDYQAPDFYRKRGYEVFGTIPDYPPGHTKYFLRKRLSGTPG